MEYQLIKVEDPYGMNLFDVKNNIKVWFDYTIAKFYVGDILINPFHIPKNSLLNLISNEIVKVQESENFYLLQIFGLCSEGHLRCKFVNYQGFEELVRINTLAWYPNFTKVATEDFEKLIGEIIIVDKKNFLYLLMTSKSQVREKTNISDLVSSKIGNGTIFQIDKVSVWAKLKDNSIFKVSLPIFLKMNQLESHENLVDRKVSVTEIKKIKYFKLKKESSNLSINTQDPISIFGNEKSYNLSQNSSAMHLNFRENTDLLSSSQELLKKETVPLINSSFIESSTEKNPEFPQNECFYSLAKNSEVENEMEMQLHYKNKSESYKDFSIKQSQSSSNIKKDSTLNKILSIPRFVHGKSQDMHANFRIESGEGCSRTVFDKESKIKKNISIQLFSNKLVFNTEKGLYRNLSFQMFSCCPFNENESKLNPNFSIQMFSCCPFNENESKLNPNFILQMFSCCDFYENESKLNPNFSIQQQSHEFISENELKIDYSTHDSIYRFKCLDLLQVFDKPGFSYKDFSLSEPIMNKNLGSVIGFGIIEHLIRFNKDFGFKYLIEKLFTRSGVFSIYNDILAGIKNVQELYSNIKEFSVNIKRIGEGVLSLIQHDIETLKGLQELVDLIGCCIHLRNFTQEFKEIKIVPTNYQIKRRPIINLGKYFNDYFLLYYNNLTENKPIMNFPFYDEDLKHERNLLKSFNKALVTRISEIRDYLNKKLTGIKVDPIKSGFEDVVQLYDNYFYDKYKYKGNGKFKSMILSLNFADVIYKFTGKKFFCNCGCNKYLDEATNPKKTCYCQRDFSSHHLNLLNSDMLCWCGTMSVNAILMISYNTVS